MLGNITPVPNAVFDGCLRELKCAELKILLVIIRQTLGWEDQQNDTGRKSQDWISSSQMQAKTGCSQRAITSATEILVQKKLISVFDGYGCLLDSPKRRKGKTKLFYALASAIFSIPDSVPIDTGQVGRGVESGGITGAEGCNSGNTSASFADAFRKKCIQLAQKLRITKETLTKEIITK